MLSLKNSSNVHLISLFQTYIIQELVGTRKKIASSASDQIVKYDKF